MDEYLLKLAERVALLEERLAGLIRAHNELVKVVQRLEEVKHGNN